MARKKRHDPVEQPQEEAPTLQETAIEEPLTPLKDEEPAAAPRTRSTTVSRDDVMRLLRLLQTTGADATRSGVVDGLMNAVLGDEGLVRNLTDRNIPKEAAGFLVAGAESTRREVVRIVSKEVRNFLASVDLGGELTKILTSVTFEMSFKAGFVPNDRTTPPTAQPLPQDDVTQPPATTRNYKERLWNVVNDRLIQPSLSNDATQTAPDVTEDDPEPLQ